MQSTFFAWRPASEQDAPLLNHPPQDLPIHASNRLAAAKSANQDSIVCVDEHGRICAASQQACELFGIESADIDRLTIADLDYQCNLENWSTIWSQLVSGSSVRRETEFRAQRGQPIAVDCQLQMVAEEPPFVAFFVRDVSSRIGELLNEKIRFESFSRHIHDVVWLATLTGEVLFINDAVNLIYGRDALAFKEKPTLWKEVVHPDDRAIANESEQRLSQYGSADVEYRILTPDGNISWLHDRKSIVGDDAGQPMFICGVASDITHRKLAEESLWVTNQTLTAIHDIQSQFIADSPSQVVFDELLNRLLSLSESEYGFIGEKHYDSHGKPYLKTHAITNVAWNEETRKFYEENAPTGLEFTNLESLFGEVIVKEKTVMSNSPRTDPRRAGTPDGHPPLNAFLGIPLFAQHKMIGMAGLANRKAGYDEQFVNKLQPFLAVCASLLTAHRAERERRTAESNLHASERRFRALIENSFDAIWLISRKGVLEYSSSSILNLLGYQADELNGHPVQNLIHAEDVSQLNRHLKFASRKEKSTLEFRIRLRHRDGDYRLVEVKTTTMLHDASVDAIVWNFRDITDSEYAQRALREKENQLMHVTRLSVMGEMVAGIAHEINQPLSAIANFADVSAHLLQEGDQPDSSQTADLIKWNESICEQAVRCGEIIRRLRRFVNKDEDHRELFDVDGVVRESIEILKADVRFDDVGIHWLAPDETEYLFGNRIQLQQVIVNLIRNACEVTLECQVSHAVNLDTSTSDDRILISVHDRGPGIETDRQESIFEPFVSTKDAGLGIGLAISRTIVEHHMGRLWVESTPGEGASFHIQLPLADSDQCDEWD